MNPSLHQPTHDAIGRLRQVAEAGPITCLRCDRQASAEFAEVARDLNVRLLQKSKIFQQRHHGLSGYAQ